MVEQVSRALMRTTDIFVTLFSPLAVAALGLAALYLGFSAVVGVYLDVGVAAVYAGIVLFYATALGIVVTGFEYGGWAGKVGRMMDERAGEGTDT